MGGHSHRIPELENGVVRGPLVVLTEPRNGHPNHGMRALMLAVFEDAVRCYLSGNGRVKIEAQEWVHSRQRRSPFSFVVVCETLGLAPTAVRAALQRFRDQQLSPPRTIARARPYSRRHRRPLAVRLPRPQTETDAKLEGPSGGERPYD